MIIAIDGHRFDTNKAKRHFRLSHFDGSNMLNGDLYLSSQGTWYIETPSQWSNGHRWETIDPHDAIERYARFLDADEIDEIVELAGLTTE